MYQAYLLDRERPHTSGGPVLNHPNERQNQRGFGGECQPECGRQS